MKLIVGLGNPGIEYQFTPHNMGFLAIDRIAGQCGVNVANRHCKAVTARAIMEGQPVLLAKPETYMNRSGESVRELLEGYEADPAKDLIVLYDELALPFGSIRVRMVEYTPGYVADHWCSKGHILLCLEGELHTELQDGRRFVLQPGMSYQVADGAEAHRSSTAVGARLFVVD